MKIKFILITLILTLLYGNLSSQIVLEKCWEVNKIEIIKQNRLNGEIFLKEEFNIFQLNELQKIMPITNDYVITNICLIDNAFISTMINNKIYIGEYTLINETLVLDGRDSSDENICKYWRTSITLTKEGDLILVQKLLLDNNNNEIKIIINFI